MLSLGCSQPKAPEAKPVSTTSIGLIQSVAVMRIGNYRVATQINAEKAVIMIEGTITEIPIGKEATISIYNNGAKSIDWEKGGYWISR